MREQMFRALAAGILVPAAMWGQIGNIVVTNAASFRVGVPQPGSIGTVFCTGLSVNGIVSATGAPLPFSLAGVTVSIGGAPAPLFAVADLGGYQQVNFQVPLEAQFTAGYYSEVSGSTQVVVSQNGVQGSATVPVDTTTPGEFFRLGSTQYGVFQHVDYSLVTEESPALPGEIIIAYLTGLQTATPAVPTGQPAPADPLSVECDRTPTLSVNRHNLQLGPTSIYDPYNVDPGCIASYTQISGPITYIGLSPTSVGLFQINFTVPASAPAGDQPLILVWRRCWRFPGGITVCNPSDQLSSQPVLLPVGLGTH
ncbi:MAG: hypothetical protein ABSH05_22175 [Bryobacteraceae bacterium]|jgi:uncharacterized protein (TIGR03437 family)